MSERRILIADDEELARARLERLITQMAGYSVCATAEDGETALSEAARTHPDIVLLDIRMPGTDGMKAAEQLSQLSTPPALIFCTAYDHYALDAFRVQAAAYLVKPVRQEALQQALEKAARVNRLQQDALEKTGDAEEPLSIRSHRGVELIDPTSLYYCMADNKYVTLIHRQGESVCDHSLKELEAAYPERLLRIHRNTLVNTDYLVALVRSGHGRHKVRLSDPNDTHLPVSRRHVSTVREWLDRN